MDKKDNLNQNTIPGEWSTSDLVHPDTTGIEMNNIEPKTEVAREKAERLKELSEELRKDIKDNYKGYKKTLKNSDDPLADEKLSVAKDQSDELQNKIKSGIERQRDDLLGREHNDRSLGMEVYLQDPMYGGAFFPDPTMGGVYPNDVQALEEHQKEEAENNKVNDK